MSPNSTGSLAAGSTIVRTAPLRNSAPRNWPATLTVVQLITPTLPLVPDLARSGATPGTGVAADGGHVPLRQQRGDRAGGERRDRLHLDPVAPAAAGVGQVAQPLDRGPEQVGDHVAVRLQRGHRRLIATAVTNCPVRATPTISVVAVSWVRSRKRLARLPTPRTSYEAISWVGADSWDEDDAPGSTRRATAGR